MSDIDRTDKLAVMGIRVILKIYKMRPYTTDIEAKDTLSAKKAEPHGGGKHEYDATFEELSLGDALLGRLLREGIITGQGTTTGIVGASIPSHIRRNLTEQAGATSNIADMLGEEIAALDAGEERPMGTFTRYAQDIGYQP